MNRFKLKIITNAPDAPWTLAQSWKPYDAKHARRMVEDAHADGLTATIWYDGERVTLEQLEAMEAEAS